MKYFFILLIFVAGCKKNNDQAPAGQVNYDSVVSSFLKEYRIDLDKDQQFDFKIVWRTIPLQYSTTTYHIIPLHTNARVHVTTQNTAICIDTLPIGSSSYTNTQNCSQGGVPDSTYNYIATPNLGLNQLSQNVLTTQALDSFLIYKKNQKYDMPAPGSSMILVESGFFFNKQSGYLLLETHSKKYGLLIRDNFQPLFIEKQVEIF